MSSTFQLDPYRIAGSGHFFIATTGEFIANRNVVYVAADGFFYMADASAAGTMPALGITLTQTTQNNESKILTKGFVGNPVWTWTAGDTLYVSPIAGQLTNVQPVAPDQVQQVGIALTATQIWFDPAGIGGAAGAPPTGIPVNVGAANAQGADAVNYVRRDHIHAHPNLSGLVTPAHAHADLSTVTFAQHHAHFSRVDEPIGANYSAANANPVAARVYIRPLNVVTTRTYDILGYICATANGNVRMCFYEDNGDTPVGGALIVETASVACAVVAQEIAIAATQIDESLIHIALQFSDATAVLRVGSWQHITENNATVKEYFYDRGGGYGAFTDPCPAAAVNTGQSPVMFSRVASLP